MNSESQKNNSNQHSITPNGKSRGIFHISHISILIIFFLLGIASNVAQSIIFREFIVIFYGNELILGFILFFWLFSITMGAFVYTPLSKIIPDLRRLFLNLIFVFSMLPLILIPFIRLARTLTGTPYGQFVPFSGMAWISFLAIFPTAFLIGVTFPLGCKILNDNTAVAKVYMVESLGSLFGGVIFSFLLIRVFSTPFIAALILSLFSLAIILYHIMSKTGMKPLKKIFIFMILALSFLLLPAASLIETKSVEGRWQTLIKDLPLLKNIDSPYQNLALTKQMDQYSIFFNGVYGFAFPDDYEDAVSAHHILTQHPEPQDILIIGEVNPGFIKESLKEPIKSITIVYLDPAIYDIMEPVLSPEDRQVLNDPRVIREVGDGRFFVKNTGKKFDLVFLNLPDPSTAFMNRFYTQDFFREVKRILNPGGVLGLSITSSENYLGAQILDYNTSIYRTLKSVFPYIAISPGTYTFFFASTDQKASTDDYNILFKRYEKRQIKAETTFTPYLFETLYEKDRIDFKRNLLDSKPNGRINTDLSPVAYLYNLKLWGSYSGSHLNGLFTFLEQKGLSFWLLLMGIFMILSIIGSIVFKPGKIKAAKACSLITVFTTGLCAMGLSIILIYSYQNLYGYLFQRIGFLIALFMLGLSIGGASVHFLIKKGKAGMPVFIIIQVLITLLCLFTPSILNLLGHSLNNSHSINNEGSFPVNSQFFFFSLMILTGILTGHILPLAAHLLKNWGTELGKSAAYANSADHLGGCIGALLIGAFFVPLMGFINCARFLGAMEMTGLVLWGVWFVIFKNQKKSRKTP